jgi:hypothetical protein
MVATEMPASGSSPWTISITPAIAACCMRTVSAMMGHHFPLYSTTGSIAHHWNRALRIDVRASNMQQDARSGDLVVIGHSSGGGLLQYAHAPDGIEARCAQSARCDTSLRELRCILVLAGDRPVGSLAQPGALPTPDLTNVSQSICSSNSWCTSIVWGTFRVQTMDASLWNTELATLDIRRIMGLVAEQTKVAGGE